jgi:ERCC4-related helicase
LNLEEKQLLEQMHNWAVTAERNPDSKAQKLLAWLEEVIRPEGKWSNQRVIIFTEYRATQKWLYDLLANRGFAKDNRLMTMYGGINRRMTTIRELKGHIDLKPLDSNSFRCNI